MRLLLAELRKVWGRRVTALCLAVLAGANLFLLYTGTKPGANAAPASAWRAVGRELRGLSTAQQQALINEKLDTAKGVYQVGQLLYDYALNAQYGYMSDPRTQYPELFEQYEQVYQDKSYTLYTENLRQEVPFLTTVKAELDTVAGYPEFLADVQAKAQQLSGISIFQNSQSGYDLENIDKTAAVYAGMGGVQINYAPQKGLYTALDYPFTDLILLAAMLLLASLLVRAERDSGMLAFVRTTPGGRLKTAAAKLGALAVSLLAVLVLLYGVNLAYCQLTFGLGPLDRSIQSVPALMRCTMRITVGQYLGLFLLAKWAGAFVMGLWVMLAALVCRRAAAGWCAGLALPAAQWLIRQAIPATSRLNVVKYANLASLLRTNELLGNYRNLYWFDHPVPLPLVEWTAAALWCAALLAVFCLVFCRAALLPAPAFAGLRLGKPRTRPTTIWGQEARKLALSCGALAVLAAFAGYQAWQTAETKSFIDADEIYYQYYMTHISGPYDQEAYQWLQEQSEEFEPIRRLERALQAGEITSEEYQLQMGAYYGLNQKKQVFDRVIYGNLPYLQEHPGAQLVYESGWEELFCFAGEDDLRDALVAGLLDGPSVGPPQNGGREAAGRRRRGGAAVGAGGAAPAHRGPAGLRPARTFRPGHESFRLSAPAWLAVPCRGAGAGGRCPPCGHTVHGGGHALAFRHIGQRSQCHVPFGTCVLPAAHAGPEQPVAPALGGDVPAVPSGGTAAPARRRHGGPRSAGPGCGGVLAVC